MSKTTKVLVVDDKINVRRSVKNMLKGFDCTFSEAARGEDALCLIRLNLYDVIFIDIRLPGISGIETLRRAKQIQPNLGRVIILTGYPEDETRIEAGELGAFAYLDKAPMSRDEIRDTFIRAANWSPEIVEKADSEAFVCIRMVTSTSLEDDYERAIKTTVESFGFNFRRADTCKEPDNMTCLFCGSLRACQLAIMDISGLDPNILFDVGLAIGQEKRLILLKNTKTKMPLNLVGREYIEYSDLDSLKTGLEESLKASLK